MESDHRGLAKEKGQEEEEEETLKKQGTEPCASEIFVDKVKSTAPFQHNDLENEPKFTAVQKGKWGKIASVVRGPIKKKWVRLSTFNTSEDASKAYLLKKQVLLDTVKKGFNPNMDEKTENAEKEAIICVESSKGNSSLMPNGHGAKSSNGCSNTVTSNTKAKRGLPGIHREKSGRYSARIRDPITHKRVSLGIFDTAEKASEAYVSKKSEFEKLNKGNKVNEPIIRVESPMDNSSLMPNAHGSKSSNGCINTVTSHPKANTGLLGIQRQKSGRYAARIGDPITHKRVWLGTFDTVEEASEAYFSKKSKFEKLKKGNKVNEPIISAESSKETSCLEARVHGAKPSDGCISTVTSHPKAKRRLHGIQMQNNGWYDAVGRDPIRHKKKEGLCTDTIEEGSKAYFSKKSEFEKLSMGNKENEPKNCDQTQPESPVGELLSVDNDQTRNAASLGRNRIIDSYENTHFAGAYKRKSGRYSSTIKAPIGKRTIWLGTFDTAEEASQAYQSKKLEFQKLVEAKQQCNWQTHSSAGEKKQGGKVELVNVPQRHEAVILEGFQLESASGASTSEVGVPMSNPSNKGSDERINSRELSHSIGVQKRKSGKCSSDVLLGTDEEASHADQCKKFDLQSSKNAELESNMPSDSSAWENQEGQEDEDLWVGQWVQLPGNKAVKFSLKLGVPIVDNYGYLLGEFSSLDDLSLC